MSIESARVLRAQKDELARERDALAVALAAGRSELERLRTTRQAVEDAYAGCLRELEKARRERTALRTAALDALPWLRKVLQWADGDLMALQPRHRNLIETVLVQLSRATRGGPRPLPAAPPVPTLAPLVAANEELAGSLIRLIRAAGDLLDRYNVLLEENSGDTPLWALAEEIKALAEEMPTTAGPEPGPGGGS